MKSYYVTILPSAAKTEKWFKDLINGELKVICEFENLYEVIIVKNNELSSAVIEKEYCSEMSDVDIFYQREFKLGSSFVTTELDPVNPLMANITHYDEIRGILSKSQVPRFLVNLL